MILLRTRSRDSSSRMPVWGHVAKLLPKAGPCRGQRSLCSKYWPGSEYQRKDIQLCAEWTRFNEVRGASEHNKRPGKSRPQITGSLQSSEHRLVLRSGRRLTACCATSSSNHPKQSRGRSPQCAIRRASTKRHYP